MRLTYRVKSFDEGAIVLEKLHFPVVTVRPVEDVAEDPDYPWNCDHLQDARLTLGFLFEDHEIRTANTPQAGSPFEVEIGGTPLTVTQAQQRESGT